MMKAVGVPDTLPDGWARCSLGQVTLPTMKIRPADDPGREVRYIDISSIDNSRYVIASTKQYTLANAPSRARQIVRAGDTLFSTVRPYLRNIALVPNRYDKEIASTGFSVLRPAKGICPAFLFYTVISSGFVNRVSKMQYGVSYPAVKDDQLRDLDIRLPPTAEQYRIAAKLDELFSTIDNGIESLKMANVWLSYYRQTLLRYAFEGKLTKQWRKENKDSLETSEQLVARIKQERDATYKQKLHHWKVARIAWKDRGKHGGMPNKPKRPSTTTEVPHDVLQTLSILADSWVWGPLAWMTCGVEYGTAAKSEPSGEVPVLRMGNIRDGMFDWSDLVYTSDEREIQKYSLHDGDVLFNRTNSPELVGKSAVYRGTKRALFAGYLIRINHLRSVVQSDYLSFFLNSAVARQYGRTVKTDGVNQSNISGSKLLSYPFPFCSIEEQCEISRILNKVSSFVEAMENDIVTQIDLATSLRQAILESAFSGRLVAQDPSDEPASVLLGRIRSEREQATTHRSSRNKRQRQANEAAG